MLVIAGVDLRRRLRNRSALMMGFVGPLVLAGVFGLLISGTSSVTFTIGVVDQDGSGLTRDLVADLTAPARCVSRRWRIRRRRSAGWTTEMSTRPPS